MEPETPKQFEELPPIPEPEPYRGLRWIFIGEQGLRAGWSVVVFVASMMLIYSLISMPLTRLNGGQLKPQQMPPQLLLVGEAIGLISVITAAWIVTLIERRKLLDFNLRGPRRTRHLFAGLATGFVALSALVGALAAGGWLHFGGVALSGTAILKFGLIYGCLFLLVGCVEEGTFRCYLQFTLTRGINFWWALGLVAAMCAWLTIRHGGNGAWGVYTIAVLGFFPCVFLHQVAGTRSSFWQAAWVTSTLFGFVHTGNGGENPVGIFQAAFVGVIFCISIKLTGSAWWAIGTHAGWDWAQTYFYGTPDSGMVGQGHLLNSTMTGNVLWSGGADGPEGSLLGVAVLVLLLVWLLVAYRRRKSPEPEHETQPVA